MTARRVSDAEGLKVAERNAQPANAPTATETGTRLAAAVGNRCFARFASQAGQDAEILPSGLVHPDVQTAIDRSRSGGAPLDAGTRTRVAEALGDPLDDVKVHTDSTAAALARSVDARAFTTGSDIYFGAGEYRPQEAAGAHLLAHELTHVVQQRGGPTSGPLTVTEPGDTHELEAEAVADELGG